MIGPVQRTLRHTLTEIRRRRLPSSAVDLFMARSGERSDGWAARSFDRKKLRGSKLCFNWDGGPADHGDDRGNRWFSSSDRDRRRRQPRRTAPNRESARSASRAWRLRSGVRDGRHGRIVKAVPRGPATSASFMAAKRPTSSRPVSPCGPRRGATIRNSGTDRRRLTQGVPTGHRRTPVPEERCGCDGQAPIRRRAQMRIVQAAGGQSGRRHRAVRAISAAASRPTHG